MKTKRKKPATCNLQPATQALRKLEYSQRIARVPRLVLERLALKALLRGNVTTADLGDDGQSKRLKLRSVASAADFSTDNQTGDLDVFSRESLELILIHVRSEISARSPATSFTYRCGLRASV